MDLGLRERAAVVTGGSSGIGRVTAARLSTEGAHVLLIGRREDALREAAAECGASARWLALDLTEGDAGERVAAECARCFGRFDILVNSASTSTVRAIEDLADADFQAAWEINVMAPLRLIRAALPVMTQAGWGRVVNVSSSSGKRPGQRNVAYSVAKAAELSLSRAYADAYASQGVLINAVTPGPVASELWLKPGGLADQTAQARGISREEVLESAASALPVKRLASAAQIADVIVFLCSEAAGYVSGAAWSVDGGAVPVII